VPSILLVDADAFFVAVARKVDPDGAGNAPLLIVGGHPGSRGVVCSASYETRAYGVRSAMPISQALRLCPKAMCVPVQRQACADTSRAIRRVLENFTPIVEGASIDEWYLDLTGTDALYHHAPLADTARRIRAAVFASTSMYVSIGGGSSKLIAKLAVEHGKPSRAPLAGGVCIVEEGSELNFMRRVALAEIPGIGPKLQEKFKQLGLVTVEDVLPHNIQTLERWAGPKLAAWLHARVRGVSTSVVEPRTPVKQMSHEETFDRDIVDVAKLESELRLLASKVAADVRSDGMGARTVTVKLRDKDFKTRTAGRTLPEPVESDRAIIDTALSLLAKLRGGRATPVRLVGVALSNFRAARDAEQMTMFSGTGTVADAPEQEKDRELSRAMDRVRERFGDDSIRAGAARRQPIGEKGARKPRD
jgi:DNA polymerase-4